ncbi:MAG: class I SAM-dependent methyltransferase [Cyanobacteria bacterium Co-bin13]|nr:class I SAM-dependent methyltransferase [Cyanobacteria bacterium Co-bin13]
MNINPTIHADDDMFVAEHKAHYFSVGESALKNIVAALSASQEKTINTILDLPCGYGRVLRHVHAYFPKAAITACDLNRGGVDFCAETFGAKGVYSTQNLLDLHLDQTFDLIWCGSLLTHLEEDRWPSCLQFFSQHLTENGIFVFSTHGRRAYDNLRRSEHAYDLTKEACQQLFKDYEATGFGYVNYASHSDYGVSLSSPSWVFSQLEQRPELTVTAFSEHSWDQHHDVFACQKSLVGKF